jgi:acyl-CoA thioester hydrolase
MPLTHVRTFRVRHYECDAYGHVNNVNYLRYMQEAAFDASAAAGYDLARYAEMGFHWLVRDSDIEYLRPLRYGDSVIVKTWVADFRRVRSRRAYELRVAASGELAARAHTEWVFVDSVSGAPAPIPPEMILAFFPEAQPEQTPPRERFPAAPPAPPGVFRMRRMVRWQDIDPAQHVNNAVYLAYIEDCGVQVASAYGWPAARMWADGFAILSRRHRIAYREPAELDDEIEIATWISGVKRATATRHYVLTRLADGARLAAAHTIYVWTDIATGRPIRIPTKFLADFMPNVARAH